MATPWPAPAISPIQLWNVAADPVVPPPLGKALSASTGAVFAVAFSPDGRTLASGDNDGTIRLWNVADPAHPSIARPSRLTSGSETVYSMAFSPHSQMLASGNDDGTIGLWNVAAPAHPQPVGPPLTGGTEARLLGGVQPRRPHAGQRQH